MTAGLTWRLRPPPWPREVWLDRATVPRALLTPANAARLPAAGGSRQNGRRAALLLRDGRIAAVEPIPFGSAPVMDLDEAVVFSGFVDPHTHLDKGDLLAMGLPVHRRLFDAIDAVRADYRNWTADELQARTDFALRSAYANGVRSLNTYADWPVDANETSRAPGDPLLSWNVLQSLRESWRGRIEVHLTSLVTIDAFADRNVGERIARHLAESDGVLGVFVYPAQHVPPLIDRVFELAERHDLPVDFHVDEHLQPALANLPHVAAAAARHQWGARTVCGHACVLQTVSPGERDAMLDAVAEAGIGLVALPATNLHLQDSAQDPPWTTPRLRGVLPVHEARQLGIRVAFGADNHRDPFHPAGDLDPLQTLALAAAVAQLDDPALDWADAITTLPARFLHSTWDGLLTVGAPADFVIHCGRSSPEVIARTSVGRRVVRDGQPLDGVTAHPPDPRELDPWRERRAVTSGAQG